MRDAALARLIQDLVAPHIVAKADPRQSRYVAAVDEAIAAQLRRVLHDPAFQALESAWRGLSWLLAHLQPADAWQVHVLDLSRQELAADLSAAAGDLRKSRLFQGLVEQQVDTAGGRRWSALLGLYTFGPGSEDIQLLAALGELAAHAGGPFLGGAAAEVVGCRSLAATPDPDDWQPLEARMEGQWQTLRRSPSAAWLGLALPRFLLRLPYGQASCETDEFPFEEVPADRAHESFLWGHPALVCGALLGPEFVNTGRAPDAGETLELDDLPAYTYEADGETRLLPCTEVRLNDRAALAILRRGLMPLLSYRDRSTLRLARFQSLADPPTALRGSLSFETH